MRRAMLLGVLIAAGASVHPGPAAAAFPASATIREGIGGGGATIGSPLARVTRAWGLKCPRLRPGEHQGRCTAVSGAEGARHVNGIAFDQLGRVTEVSIMDPRWRTTKGIGPGVPMARLRRAYRGRFVTRVTRAWTYFEVDNVVGGRPRRTFFLGRTRYGDVWSVTVLPIQRITLAVSRPAEGGLVVSLSGGDPLADYPLDVEAGGRAVPLKDVRTDRRGSVTFRDPPYGAVDQALIGASFPATIQVTAPAGTPSIRRTPLRIVRRLRVAALPPPPIPSFTVTPARATGTDASVRAAISGGGAGVDYRVIATWSCPAGAPGESELESLIGPAAETTLFLTDIRPRVFDPDCVGSPVPAERPLTLSLRAEGRPGPLVSRDIVLEDG